MKTTGLFCLGLVLVAVAFAGCTRRAPPPPTETISATTTTPGPSFLLDEFEGPRAHLHGTVLINGEAARDHSVVIWWRGNGVGPLSLPTAPVTDDGRYDFGVIPAGEMILYVSHGSSCDTEHRNLFSSDVIDLQDGEERIEDVSIETRSVRGHMLYANDGSPVQGATIKLGVWDGHKKGLGGFYRTSSDGRVAVVDESGRFEFGTVLHGEWRLTIYPPRSDIGDEDHRLVLRTTAAVGDEVHEIKDVRVWLLHPWFWPVSTPPSDEWREAHDAYFAKYAQDGFWAPKIPDFTPREIKLEFD